jgi:hypothetical protein
VPKQARSAGIRFAPLCDDAWRLLREPRNPRGNERRGQAEQTKRCRLTPIGTRSQGESGVNQSARRRRFGNQVRRSCGRGGHAACRGARGGRDRDDAHDLDASPCPGPASGRRCQQHKLRRRLHDLQLRDALGTGRLPYVRVVPRPVDEAEKARLVRATASGSRGATRSTNATITASDAFVTPRPAVNSASATIERRRAIRASGQATKIFHVIVRELKQSTPATPGRSFRGRANGRGPKWPAR